MKQIEIGIIKSREYNQSNQTFTYTVEFNDLDTISEPHVRFDPYVTGDFGELAVEPQVGDEVILARIKGESIILGVTLDSTRDYTLSPRNNFIQTIWANPKIRDNRKELFWANAVTGIVRTFITLVTPKLDADAEAITPIEIPISFDLSKESILGNDGFQISDGELVVQFTSERINLIRVRDQDKFQSDGWLYYDTPIMGPDAAFFTPGSKNPDFLTGLGNIITPPVPLPLGVWFALTRAADLIGIPIQTFLLALGIPPQFAFGLAEAISDDLIFGNLFGLITSHNHRIYTLDVFPFRLVWRD